MKTIEPKGIQVAIIEKGNTEYISLTDIARYKSQEQTGIVIAHWLSTRFTVEFMGVWEQVHNPNFNVTEFSYIKNSSGSNGFVLSVSQWVEKTNAIGIFARPGRYHSGTFAHRDIAFEFASWISAEFKLYLIKEFQRLKTEESEKLELGWDTKRMLTKINYRIHTDAIKEKLIPGKLTLAQTNIIYASEADILNKALFGLTAKEWRERNPKLHGNIRDYADVAQLVCLANLENLNAHFIRNKITQADRLLQLNAIAIQQMQALTNNPTVKKLGARA
ncbi:DNA-binding protein [Candidatus Wirthbacteria bacterium CG2_30_54_11]|uniref:DNA-binding protein n=1 Tax=Candidatus Wirthbacteria bacterium CG2_30_54_11 TaxID=1817892 RepID=A0A1J5IT95_9BACT|nr:MAG: DNA-binding protein [Candidatus Wirthbacteria bacterium CG2_30_54_11]